MSIEGRLQAPLIARTFARGLDLLSWRSLCVLSGVWLAWLSWMRPLTLPDEGRYAGIAWEMLRAGTHSVPLLNGMPFFHKPPLYFWLAEASFQVFGVHPWAARLPSWLAAWAAAMALYAFMRRYRGHAVATIALVVLVTQPFFFGGAQFANLDMLVAGMVTLTTLAGATALQRSMRGESWRGFSLATGVLAGLGVLAKGLIGLVFPAGILLIWIVMLRQWRHLGALLWPPAILAFLAVCLPWFLVMQKQFPGFFDYFFVYQQFDRFAATTFNNRQPLWFYFPVVAGLMLPWTLWLGAVFRGNFWAPRDPDAYAVRLLMCIWTILILVFFSIPTSKLIGYALPVLPPLAALVAEVIGAGLKSENALGTRRGYHVCAGAAATLCIVATVLATIYARPNSMPLGASARAQFEPGDQVVMLHSYAYDLPMALGDTKPTWVVDNWLNPEIPVRDNWRKELYDSGLFKPEVMKQALISYTELRDRICAAAGARRFWVLGEPLADQQTPLLRGLHPYAISGTRALWLVVPNADLKNRYCTDAAPAR
jgi:4-amino-4-deoxy-L-arabinose transferase-like glycosyltransferase